MRSSSTALENVALNKPAEQSSNLNPRRWHAPMAVDGNRDSNFDHNSCTHTDPDEAVSWLRVDLQAQFTVYAIRLTAASGQCVLCVCVCVCVCVGVYV